MHSISNIIRSFISKFFMSLNRIEIGSNNCSKMAGSCNDYHKNQCSYNLSQTCQIPHLADLYELYLGFKTKGFFVEFGAFDGEYASNTSGLADFGWEGIYIEPVSKYFEMCKERHKKNNIKVLKNAIGNTNCKVEISVGGPLSTISNDLVNKFESMAWSRGYHKGEREIIDQKKLDDILIENNVPINFDIMSVDVEGYEWQALEDFNIKRWSPKMVIVELHDNNINYDVEWDNCNKLVQYFEKNGYRVVYKDFSNTVYVRNDTFQVKGDKLNPQKKSELATS